MAEKTSIVARSDLIPSKKSGRVYFTVVDETDRKLICFNPKLYDHLAVGSVVELGITPGKNPEDTPRITSIVGVATEPETKTDKPPYKPKPEYRGRDDEPAPQAVGMTVKQVYEMIRDKTLEPIFGREAAGELVQWYRSQILGTTRISFNGADLPPASQPEQPKTISVGDIKEAREKYGWSLDDMVKFCRKEKGWKIDKTGELDQAQRKELIDYIKAHPKK
jgi:hypothetical protein